MLDQSKIKINSIKYFINNKSISFIIKKEKININAGKLIVVDYINNTLEVRSLYNTKVIFTISYQGRLIKNLNKYFFNKLDKYTSKGILRETKIR